MAIERRDFIKSGFVGLSAGLMGVELANAQSSGHSTGVFEGGTGCVRVSGQLKAGVLTVEAQDFVKEGDRCLVMNGRLAKTDLYCSMFSYKDEETIFVVLRSNGHKTSVLLSDSDDPKIARLVAWNDLEAPNTFRIDKEKFMETQKLKEAVLEGKGDSVDLVGKRNPPQFTLSELEAVFGDNEALNDLMRGHRSHHNLRADNKLLEFLCFLISTLPGSLTGLAWYTHQGP